MVICEEGVLPKAVPAVYPAVLYVRRATDKSISSAQPFSIDRLPIGFHAILGVRGTGPSKTTLQHLYPWVPSPGEDFSALLESLLSMPSPRWIVVRIGNDLDGSARGRALERLERAIDICERLLAGTEPGQLTYRSKQEQ